MGFRTGAYATIWEVKQGNGNYTDVRMNISKKNKQTNQYEVDFSGYVRLIGTAHQRANTLKEKSKIKIGDCEVTNSYNKEKNVTYTNYAVFSFEDVTDSANNNATTQNNNGSINVPTGLEEELPFN